MTTLKFTDNMLTPHNRCRLAVEQITREYFYDNQDSKQPFEIDGVQLLIVSTEEQTNSYGDDICYAIVDTPTGLFRFQYRTSYGNYNVTEVEPVRLESKPVYEYEYRS